MNLPRRAPVCLETRCGLGQNTIVFVINMILKAVDDRIIGSDRSESHPFGHRAEIRVIFGKMIGKALQHKDSIYFAL